MKKEARRAAKAAAREARAQTQVQAGVPIFWVEPTGRTFYRGSYRCEAGHYQRREIAAFEIPEEPIPKPFSDHDYTEGHKAGANDRLWFDVRNAGTTTERLEAILLEGKRDGRIRVIEAAQAALEQRKAVS